MSAHSYPKKYVSGGYVGLHAKKNLLSVCDGIRDVRHTGQLVGSGFY